MKRLALFALPFLLLPLSALAAEEPPLLAPRVERGELPPLAERLPETPRTEVPQREGWRSGAYGGDIRMLARGGRDARDVNVLSYARLMVWDENLELKADILESVEVEEDGRRFVLKLRPGHSWSDGHPFTSEDFRFWWEDVAQSPALSPAGLPAELLAGGEAPKVTFPDETKVIYEWPVPNNRFLPALAATGPLTLYRPAHVLKDSHPAYADGEALNARAEAAGLPGWAALFERQDTLYGMNNPNTPTLQAWRVVSGAAGERWTAERNPYFHRLDGDGRQLPYIDRVVLSPTQQNLIAAKAAAGESDLQARGLTLTDVTLLKNAAGRSGDEGGIAVHLWPIGRGAQLALYPNVNAADPQWRELMRTADFRRALSLAIDRGEINQSLYQGLALGGNNSVLPRSPLYEETLRFAWAEFDPERANTLLDGLGLAWDAEAQWRLLPDGRPMQLVVATGDVDPAETDILELVRDTYAEIGIELLTRPTARQNFRNQVRSGDVALSVFYGLANGLATPQASPAELAPSSANQNNWPLWGLYQETGGAEGEAPEGEEVLRLIELLDQWSTAANTDLQRRAWTEMLEIHAEQVFTIGLIAQAPQPVVANARLRNLPPEGDYLYEPGAYFGRYRPDTFWYAE